MSVSAEPSAIAWRLFAASSGLHGLALLFVLGMSAVAVPMDREVAAGALRLFAFVAGASMLSFGVTAGRVRTLGGRLRAAIEARASAEGGPPPETMLVRSLHLMPTEAGTWAFVAVGAASLAEVSDLFGVSKLPLNARLAVALLCIAALEVVAHVMGIRIRRELWALLRELDPDDVTIHAPQRFQWRLGSRLVSAAVAPALCVAALVVGRPGIDPEGARVIAVCIAIVALVGSLVALQTARVAERDIRALATHVDRLLAREALDAGTVSEWGGESMRTSAAVEIVDAMQLLASRYARLANEEARARRAIEEAHMLRTRFMAYMSHDLRSPLNSITGFAEVLAMQSEGPLNEEQMESVLAIRESGQDLVRLVTNLVDAARLEAGRMTIFPAWTPPVELAEEAIVRAQRGGRAPAPIRVETTPGLPTVYVDAERTIQALSALLFHLMRDCGADESGPPIRIRLHLDPAGATHVLVDVHGRGRLEAREYARILEGFFQLEGGGRGASGMGIGLALSRALIVEQGGGMWCEAVESGETRFRIALPADPRARGSAGAHEAGVRRGAID